MAKKRRRNDSQWRKDCLERRGAYCRSCGLGDERNLQIDHIVERSQGGASVVENGLVLCGPWSMSVPGGCHLRKTEGRMLIERQWLDEDQVEWLSEQGWVTWDDSGEPYGRGSRAFAAVSKEKNG